MPIEIKELQITASVKDQEAKSTVLPGIDIIELKKQIQTDCIEAVMRILEEKKER